MKPIRLFLSCLALVAGLAHADTERDINYGLNHYHMGLYKQAIRPLQSAARDLEGKSPPDPRLVEVLIALGNMAAAEKRQDLADGFFPRALKAAEALQPPDERKVRNALSNMGLYLARERREQSLAALQRAAGISARFQGEEQVMHAIDLDNIAFAYQQLKRYPEAAEQGQKALARVKPLTQGKYLARTKGVIMHNLASTYVELQRYPEAEALFAESLAVLRAAPRGEVESWRFKVAEDARADLLKRTGRAP